MSNTDVSWPEPYPLHPGSSACKTCSSPHVSSLWAAHPNGLFVPSPILSRRAARDVFSQGHSSGSQMPRFFQREFLFGQGLILKPPLVEIGDNRKIICDDQASTRVRICKASCCGYRIPLPTTTSITTSALLGGAHAQLWATALPDTHTCVLDEKIPGWSYPRLLNREPV